MMMLASLFSALYVFLLRVLDTSFHTLRMMMMLRGRRVLVWILAFCGSVIYVVGVRQVLADMSDWVKLLGYAAGFSTGVMVGMWLEERIAVGYTRFEVVSSRRGAFMVECLRENGFAVTEVAGHGKDGAVTVVQCTVRRRQMRQVEQVILGTDPEAFVVVQDLRPMQRGYWRS